MGLWSIGGSTIGKKHVGKPLCIQVIESSISLDMSHQPNLKKKGKKKVHVSVG